MTERGMAGLGQVWQGTARPGLARQGKEMLIYTAGCYSGDTREAIDANILVARNVALELLKAGHAVYCPHLQTCHFEELCDLSHDDYLKADFNVLARCDAIVMLENWEASKGARAEFEYSQSLGIPHYFYPNLPPLHPVEVNCPEQVKTFREIIGQMYRTHLGKNADYSPMNILGTGKIGVVVRLWDKMCRILNLSGFRVKAEFVGLEPERETANESIEDSYLDAAVYSIIALLLRRGVWGK